MRGYNASRLSNENGGGKVESTLFSPNNTLPNGVPMSQFRHTNLWVLTELIGQKFYRDPPGFWNSIGKSSSFILFAPVIMFLLLVGWIVGYMYGLISLLTHLPGLGELAYIAGAGCYFIIVKVTYWRQRKAFYERLRRVDFQMCVECGYALIGLPDQHVCPECGAKYMKEESMEAWRAWACQT